MRCADWLKSYKERYERFLHTGNPATDRDHAILLHSEGDGKELPSLFVVDKPKEVIVEEESEVVETGKNQPPLIKEGLTPPPLTSVKPKVEPEIQLFIAVAGQQYGPFDYQQCKQMVQTGQLTAQSMVWMQGMANWEVAGNVTELKPLFAPAVPVSPVIPGMPPIPPAM